MSLAGFKRVERFLDQIAPALLLTLGLSISAAFTATVGL